MEEYSLGTLTIIHYLYIFTQSAVPHCKAAHQENSRCSRWPVRHCHPPSVRPTSIHPPTFPSIHPSIYLSIVYPCTFPPIYIFIYSSIHPSINPPTNPPIFYPSIHPSIHCFHPFKYLFTLLSIHHLSIIIYHSSIYSLIYQLSIHLSIHLSMFPPI